MRFQKEVVNPLNLVLVLASLAMLLVACGPVPLGANATEPVVASTDPVASPYLTDTPDLTETPTFLPSPTVLLTSTPAPLPTLAETQTADPAEGEAAILAGQAAPAYDSNLRAGPGLTFEVLDMVRAGEPLEVLGRDPASRWLLVRAPSGLEGWVAIVQFVPPVDASGVPIAEDIPVPPPPPEDEPTPAPTAPAEADAVFELPASGELRCQALTITFPVPFPVDEVGQVFVPVDPANPAAAEGPVRAYQLDRETVAPVISMYVDGSVKARNCQEGAAVCASASLTLCAAATTGASPGSEYGGMPLTLVLGTQFADEFTRDASAEFVALFRVLEP